jgi:hypothetical protein
MPLPSTYSINGDAILTKTNMKILGVLITGDLKWNDHAMYICNRVNKVIGFLHRCMAACNPKIRRSLYISLMQPIIVFGVSCIVSKKWLECDDAGRGAKWSNSFHSGLEVI